MKKLMIIFIGVGMTLVSCKTHLDSLASNSSDDVYYNPTKDHKLNTPPQSIQYDPQNQQAYNPNAGKIAATAKDNNNPYYKDPKFNYDDYYDNAYAARVSRFQKPIYGTGYYDSYYTNQYSYTGNPSQYGNSIYNSYPSTMYNSYGNGMGYGMGYGSGMGYGNGLSMGMAYGSGMGYGMGYNPYGMGMSSMYGMGYGSGMGMGYGCNPYGMGYGNGMGMGYNPYGMGMNSMYGMGYGSGMGMGYYSSPMYNTGYYNSYDYNSSTYGPRGTHSGGNSRINSPMPEPHGQRLAATNSPEITPNVAPFNPGRFNEVSIPKENYTKIVEAKNPPVMNTQQFQPNGAVKGQGQSDPVRYNPYNNPSNNNNGNYSNNYNGGSIVRPEQGGGGTVIPRAVNNNPTLGNPIQGGAVTSEPKPHKWFSGSTWSGDYNNGSNNNNNNSPTYTSPPINRGGGSWGGGNSGGGGGFGGGGGGGRSSGGGGGGRR